MSKVIQIARHTVYLALGTNMGDRRNNLVRALQELQVAVTIQIVSPVYETEPVGYLEQPRFLNLVCMGMTALAPLPLLSFAKDIEQALGRTPGIRNGPRPIDIDILLYDDLQLNTPQLTLPHPRMAERAFVLAPLADIAPELLLPGNTQNVQQLFHHLPQHGVVRSEEALKPVHAKTQPPI
jgi:2-amino-4-hydroxy-6-hydroxymethyldihydropteridine diphosphokinase